jgi:hypothetical protein
MNTPPDAPAIAQEGPRRLPQAQSGPYALIDALTAELKAVRGERDRAVAVVEAISLLPGISALLASMDERSSNRGVEGA